ncbi:hypothetical protein [Corynebacterium epidermidicanis]|uniref:Uncharacterized protein n=1 Tax=Corynebacterium epidermidicanis TaxID=1050174 RepID=A0A0G3GQZ3_9CORY|nr:hypothetical protein [Corynebacterium epidermidicanis]AKK02995.1 hypothetical protein CEPID_05650 [Corynebacterium epidermidicanis]
MNITDSNKFIHALNTIAEGVTLLGKAIEETSWAAIEDHADAVGARPITAAELYRPDLVAEAEAYEAAQAQAEQTATPEAAAAAAPEVMAEVTLVELRTLLARLSQSGLTEKVRGLLGEFGYDKLSAVPEEQYAALFARAKELK